jgi:Holliday junction DNA helicase RuvA
VIASLRGIVLDRGADTIVIEAGGVGYAVTLTAAAMRSLPPLGSEARLFIYTHALQDSPWQLYGFADGEERQVFETLLSVQGVGPRVAVALLSGLTVPELVRAITGGDLARLTQVRGIGRKIAERLSVELRDKIGVVVAAAGGALAALPAPTGVPAGKLGEVHGALLALGYKPVEFEAVLPTLDTELGTPELVKRALAALRRK